MMRRDKKLSNLILPDAITGPELDHNFLAMMQLRACGTATVTDSCFVLGTEEEGDVWPNLVTKIVPLIKLGWWKKKGVLILT